MTAQDLAIETSWAVIEAVKKCGTPLRSGLMTSRGAVTECSHGLAPVGNGFFGHQPRQGRKIRRENLTLLRSWELRFTSTPRLRVGLHYSIAAPRLPTQPEVALTCLEKF